MYTLNVNNSSGIRKYLFAIVLTGNQEEGAKIISESFRKQNVYHVDHNTFLVVHDGLTLDVAKLAGIVEEDEKTPGRTSGVVFKLTSFFTGFSRPSLWEWLDEANK